MANLIRIQRRIGHAGNRVGLEDDGAILAHDKVAARNTQAAECLMGSTGELLSTSVVLGRNLCRNAMDVRRVDILHVQIVELAVLGLTDLNDRQGAHVILAVYADGDLGALDALLDQHFVAVLKRLGDCRG